MIPTYNQVHFICRFIDIANRYELGKKISQDNLHFKKSVIPETDKLKVVQYIDQLGIGGSERQLCNLSIRLYRIGMDVKILTARKLYGKDASYLPLLTVASIETKKPRLNYSNSTVCRFKLNPPYFANYLYSLIDELISIKPDILHCWLDYPNVIGGIAGIMAGVPRIVLSGRSMNPTNFPIFNQPWFKGWYATLLKSKRVTLINNSKAGAEDYARWLNIPPSRIKVIYNGVDFDAMDNVKAEEAAAFRKSLGISQDCSLIAGVFRPDPQKLPFDFISVVKEVKKSISNVKCVIAGTGIMDREVKDRVEQEGLEDTILLLGGRTDIYRIIKASDVMLLTSKIESMPNVLLEAQYLKVPIVATNVGGVPETVEDGKSAILHPVGDIGGMAESIVRILRDKDYRQQMGLEGYKMMKDIFFMDRMVKDVLNVYCSDDRPNECLKT